MSRPTPAPKFFPYPHRTLSEVDRDEAFAEEFARSPIPRCSWCGVTIKHRIVRTCLRRTCPAKAVLS